MTFTVKIWSVNGEVINPKTLLTMESDSQEVLETYLTSIYNPAGGWNFEIIT